MKYHLLVGAALVLAAALAAGADPPKAPADRDAHDFVYLGETRPVLLRFHVRIDGKPLQDAWEAYMGKVFAYLDIDGDGVLSKEEADRIPPPQLLFSSNVVRQPGAVQVFAARGAGPAAKVKMTRQELANYYRWAGAVPFQFQQGPQQVQTTRFIIAGQPQPLSADALNEKLFALLDVNKDGKLSREELTAAPSVLQKMDLDDDETVSSMEMAGNGPTNISENVVFAVMPGPQQTPAMPFVLVAPGEANKDLARQLLQRYGPKGQKPAARKLTRKDLGLDQTTFDQLDVDQDGALDGEELARFARRAPDLEVRIELGKRAPGVQGVEVVNPAAGPAALAGQVRRTNAGSLAIDLGGTQLELRGSQGGGGAVVARNLREQYKAQFRAADRDNNGYLDRGEAERSGFFRGTFKMMDRDGDGKLFEKEMLAYLEKMEGLQAGAVASCASLSVRDQGRGLFDMVDTDNDGRLSVREMRQMVRLIDQLDRDGDGTVARKEIPHKYQVTVRQGPSGGNPGILPPAPVRVGMNQRPVPQRTAGPVWFRKMDRNQDGDVSRREFLGTDEEFKKIDADGDGLISAEEANQADRLFRNGRTAKP